MRSPHLAVAATPLLFTIWSTATAQTPPIPRAWDEQRLATMELPNAATGKPAKHVDAAFYYAVPPAVIYRTYPAYSRDTVPVPLRPCRSRT